MTTSISGGTNRPNEHTVSDRLDLDLATRHKLKPLSQEFGHDKPTRCINGSFHAELVFIMAYERQVPRVPQQPDTLNPHVSRRKQLGVTTPRAVGRRKPRVCSANAPDSLPGHDKRPLRRYT